MPRFDPLPDRRPAIVAGASSGIGAATGVELAPRGFPVALGARRVDKCQELVDQIRSAGGEAIALPLDVTDADSVKGFVHRATDELGDIELLVACAGDTYFGRLHEISTDQFESQIQVHLIGANRLATAGLPRMGERQRGGVIFVGSDVALRQRPHMGAYGAAKAALTAMVTNLQMELEGTGVRASIVHPGPTKTSMGWSLPAESIGPARGASLPTRVCGRWRTGRKGAGPATTTSCARRIWRVPSRSSPRRRAAVSSPTWRSNPRRRWPTHRKNVSNSSSGRRGCRHDHNDRAAGVRRARRARPSRGVPHRSDRVDDAG